MGCGRIFARLLNVAIISVVVTELRNTRLRNTRLLRAAQHPSAQYSSADQMLKYAFRNKRKSSKRAPMRFRGHSQSPVLARRCVCFLVLCKDRVGSVDLESAALSARVAFPH